MHEMSPDELDKILQHFYAELVKNDGTDYEPDVIDGDNIACLHRHLREYGASSKIDALKSSAECKTLGVSQNSCQSLVRRRRCACV